MTSLSRMMNNAFLLFLICRSFAQIELPPNERSHSLSQCVLSITARYFTFGQSITLSISHERLEHHQFTKFLTIGLFKMQMWPLYLTRKGIVALSNRMYSNVLLSKYYIIEIVQSQDLSEILHFLSLLKYWNPHAKFLIISLTIFNDDNEEVGNIIRLLRASSVSSIALLLASSHAPDNFNVFLWHPYKHGNCGKYEEHTIPEGVCAYGDLQLNDSLFNHNFEKELEQCTLKVRVVEWPPYVIKTRSKRGEYGFRGLEISLMNMLAEVMKVNVEYMTSDKAEDWGDVFDNGTTTGSLRQLQNYSFDIALGSYMLTLARFLVFDQSHPYMDEALVWCFPYSTVYDSMATITAQLKFEIWLIVGIIYFIQTFLLWITSRANEHESTSYNTWSKCSLKCYAIMLRSPVNIQPKTHLVRCLTAILVLFALIFTIIYETLMTSLITKPDIEQQIQSVDDIFRQNFRIYTLPNSIRYFQYEESSSDADIMNRVHKRWKSCNNMKKCLGEVAFKKRAAICLPKLYKDFVYKRYLTHDKKPLLGCLEKTVVSYQVSMLMRKGFPLLEKINTILIRIQTGGFIQKWCEDIFYRAYKNVSIQDDTKDEEEDVSYGLTFFNLKPAFILLAYGLFASMIVFIFEHLYYKRKTFYFNK